LGLGSGQGFFFRAAFAIETVLCGLLQGLFLSGEVRPASAKMADCIKPLSGIDRRPLPGDGCRAGGLLRLAGVSEYHPDADCGQSKGGLTPPMACPS